MRLVGSLLLILGLLLPVASVAQCDVAGNLEWCSRDHGFNEGATCGLNALAGAGVPLPAPVGQAILGNAWDRTNMMGATVQAWRVGARNQAVDAAICCQVHNNEVHACLLSHRDIVAQWLDSK